MTTDASSNVFAGLDWAVHSHAVCVIDVKPLVPVAPGTRIVLGVGFFVLFVAVWAAATFSGFVKVLALVWICSSPRTRMTWTQFSSAALTPLV